MKSRYTFIGLYCVYIPIGKNHTSLYETNSFIVIRSESNVILI